MKRNTYLAIAGVLLVLLGGLYYFNKDEALAPKVSKEKVKDPAANVTFMGNSIVEQLNGKKTMELSAETIQVDPESNRMTLIKLKGTLYREKGDKVDLTAAQAEYDPNTKEIVLTGDVVAKSSDGAEFTAPKVRYESNSRVFRGEGGIRLTREDTVVTGDQIETDSEMTKTKVRGNAHIVKGGQNR